ncbi:MAG: hypothetical protein ABFD08_15645 [Syntrophomonas sp.]
MRQWRVGTFSMGLLLLFTGVGLLYAQVNTAPVANIIFKWWPVILVVLGIEIVVQGYLNRNGETKIKYDVFSIFIIFLIIMAGLGLQAASEFGLAKYVQENIIADEYYLRTDREIALDKNIEKVLVEARRCSCLNIKTAVGDSIICSAQAGIRAQSRAEGQQILQERVQINTRRSGNTLYLTLSYSGANNYDNSFSLVLPERLAVELEQGGTALQLSGLLNNDWIIKGDGDTDITLPSQSDLLVSALAPNPLNLKGNLDWTNPDGQPINIRVRESDGSNEEFQAAANGQQITINTGTEQELEESTQAQAKLGQGRHKLTIMHNGNTLTVNRLP